MSRIRSVHPGLWTDEAFMSLSPFARLLYIGLWNEAWDDGVFEWKPLTIKARIFPADNIDVKALLAELEEASFIRYADASKPHGLIRNFRVFQRPKKPNSSGLLRDEDRTYVGITDESTEPMEDQAGSGGEKSPQMEDGGGKEKGEDKTAPPVVEAEASNGARFSELWELFPRHPESNERAAEVVFNRLSERDQGRVIAAASRYRQWFLEDNQRRDRTWDAGCRFAPFLAGWLKAEQWKDAAKLPISTDKPGNATPMTKLDRERDADLWKACERVMGHKAPTADFAWSFTNEVIAKARAELAAA